MYGWLFYFNAKKYMNWLKSYFTFSATERKGMLALSLLTLVLLTLYIALPWFIRSPQITTDAQLTAAFEQYRKRQSALSEKSKLEEVSSIPVTLLPFDPNTLDSTGFIHLGMRPKTVRMLLNWRRKGKKFFKKEDLKSLYTLTEEEYNRLEPYIVISAPNEHHFQSTFGKLPPLPDKIDLNTTDSHMLVRLKGIGPTLAHRIIGKRKALGGFVNHAQLLEIYRFPDTVYQMLQQRLVIDMKTVKRYSLNTVSFDELKSHPYVGEKVARNIILFREGLKGYSDIEQLRQVPLMNEEIYRKIAPYFVLE